MSPRAGASSICELALFGKPALLIPLAGPGTMAAFAGRLSPSLDALLTMHSGVSRPSYAVAGTVWQKTVSETAVEIYYFDGGDDILIGAVNPVADAFTLNPSGLGFPTAAVMRSDMTPLSFVDGRVVATKEASGQGVLELKGKTTGGYDASGIKWTHGATGAQFFDLISNGANGVRLRDGVDADVLQFLATGDVNSKLWGSLAEQIIPPGAVMMFPFTSAPPGFVKRNGALLSRSTYSRLWSFAQSYGKLVADAAWLAGAYGAFSTGDGSTTFRIPSSNGYFDRGVYDEAGYTIGTYVADAFAQHNHGVTDPTHQHTSLYPTWQSIGIQYTPAFFSLYASTTYVATTAAATNISIQNAGSGSETRPRNVALLACIKY